MKKIIVIIFLFAAVNVSAQDIPVEDTTSKPAITEIGKPDGEKSEMEIGKDGGSFTSSDGKVNLIIPEGAVSKKTTFSIQPVTNLMPNGNGKAYRLEPSGIQFQKPVQLVFHYDPEESEDSMQLLMGIAMQDDKGQWYGLNEFTLDTVAKTISGNINHFSIWAEYDKLKLIVFSNNNSNIDGLTPRLKVKNWAGLAIIGVGVTPKPATENSNDKLSELSTWMPPNKLIWRVNKIIKGDDVVGKLVKGEIDESKGRFNDYKAPDNIPKQNPVAISVELVGASDKFKGVTYKNLKLVRNILIYEDNTYEVKMTSYIDMPAGGSGTATYQDSGSFVVSLYGKEAEIIEKSNKNTSDKFHIELSGCTCKTLISGSGYIHMIGAQSITVTPATPTQPARVKIQFIRTPLILPILEFTCTADKGRTFTRTTAQANAMFAMMPAFPWSIEFTAKEGEEEWEIYETEFGIPEGTPMQGGDKALIKYIIRKLKDKEWL